MVSFLMNQVVGFITASYTLQGTHAAETEAVLHSVEIGKASFKVSGQAAYIWYLDFRTCHLLGRAEKGHYLLINMFCTFEFSQL